ncbi:non-ribosomal peptide synthetase component F [Nakamurella sp. UYEF19]|uniref:AMP-binding protein n=1 Tax=Nakamurella sp. UYEF19 TaxID=1756392 RepID=UPI003393B3D3
MNAVHLIVQEWCRQQPDACAVRDASTHRELTFRQLWQLSGSVAHQLEARGVRRGDVIGLAVPRSVDLVVGMLGILRAGAAYLALDAQAPVDRIAIMLAEAGVKVVLEAPGDSTPDPLPGWSLPQDIHRLAVPRTPFSAGVNWWFGKWRRQGHFRVPPPPSYSAEGGLWQGPGRAAP